MHHLKQSGATDNELFFAKPKPLLSIYHYLSLFSMFLSLSAVPKKNLLCSSQWLCQTILCRLVEQIEAVNETLCRIGCSELQVGSE